MIVNLARLYLAGVSPLGVSFYLEPEMEKGENKITHVLLLVILSDANRLKGDMCGSDLFFGALLHPSTDMNIGL